MSTSDAESWRPNVAAIVLDEADNVLLGITTATSRYFHFPQGGVRRRESMHDAVLREVEEEVGIPAEHLTVLARYGGLRYRYRAKNRKSRIWDGQEQTYFVMRCRGIRPAVRTSEAEEFVSTRWVPWYTLDPSMFVSFKQPVMREVLEHFFPRHLSTAALNAHLLHNCRTTRYLSPAGHPPACMDAGDRFLFAGGREEAEIQFMEAAYELLQLQRNAESRGDRLLIIPLGLPGSGLRHCLRRLARCLDPLRTRIHSAACQPGDLSFTARLIAAVPPPGQVSILLDSPYDTLLQEPCPAEDEHLFQDHFQKLQDTEKSLERQSVRVLRLYLNTSEKTALKRCASHPMPIRPSELSHLRSVAEELMEPSDWIVIPSDRKWYRDLMVIRAVAEALGSC